MSLDNKMKKNVIDLINKERDISISSISNQMNISVQNQIKMTKKIFDETKKQVDSEIKRGKSLMVIVVCY